MVLNIHHLMCRFQIQITILARAMQFIVGQQVRNLAFAGGKLHQFQDVLF